jgi:hypothetical protein
MTATDVGLGAGGAGAGVLRCASRRLAAVALALIALALVALRPGASAAATPEERAMAQALFEDGRGLMEAGRHAEACSKFEESNRLDAAMGTQYHLADCYELTGKLASAWILFVDVAAAARAALDGEREAAARRRAAALKPRLAYLVIRVPRPTRGVTIKRDGVEVRAPLWGTSVPVDPGKHVVEASAEGYRTWRRVVRVEREGQVARVKVPPLSAKPAPEPDVAVDPDPEPPIRQVAGVVMGVMGLLALGVGTAAGVIAINKTSEADSPEHCPEADACFDSGLALRDEARQAAAVSTVSLVIGGGALIGGLILWFTAPGESPQAGARPGAPVAGGGVGGSVAGVALWGEF